METVIIVIHLMVVLAMVLVVLLQRSEGGALGIGGGGGVMSNRGTANVLTRATAILAVVFFATSLGLTILARQNDSASSILDSTVSTQPSAPAGDGTGSGSPANVLDALKGQSSQPTGPQVPTPQ
ncbi:MAG: preprotein translocase subunit SecG [Stappiaceae bacterium]